MGNQRKANFELLRIVAMVMIVILHYLSKGELLSEHLTIQNPEGYFWWILEAFCAVAVNVYVLLSGYLLIQKPFRVKRVLAIWLQVLFYSVLIPIILLAIGELSIQELSVYDGLFYVFPILTEHYWFLSSYIILAILSPLLNYGIEKLPKVQLQQVMLLLFLLFSISKSIIPFDFALDQFGYGLEWMICVYVLGAYIRIYGIPFYDSKGKSILAYGLGVLLMAAALFTLSMFENGPAVLYKWRTESYQYNHIFNLFASVSLFYFFVHLTIEKGPFAQVIGKVSPYVLGVYLLHEHMEVRYRWIEWFGVIGEYTIWQQVLHMAAVIPVVFLVGVGVDYVRSKLCTIKF
ncbi:MAG: acyltransferase [Eubacteriales bacterium]